jgi:hypothetical protein
MTVLALALVWVAIGGVGLSLVSPTFAGVGVPWMLYAIVGLAYGISALLAAVGIWKLAPWAYRAFQIWGASALLAGSLPLLTSRDSVQSWWMLPLGWALLLAVFLPLAVYVRKSVRAAV